MKIILDTNVIHRDYTLTGGYVLKLCDAAKKLGYEVCVPQVVIDEIFNQYCQELKDAYENCFIGFNTLKYLTDENLEISAAETFVEDAFKAKTEQYLKRLKEIGFGVLPYPDTRHDVIVAKELEGRKPFASSKKGYRDALIWESVKEQLVPLKNLFGETQVLFLSKNTKDFAAKSGGLHSDLI